MGTDVGAAVQVGAGTVFVRMGVANVGTTWGDGLHEDRNANTSSRVRRVYIFIGLIINPT
jgi:hypothetical protein